MGVKQISHFIFAPNKKVIQGNGLENKRRKKFSRKEVLGLINFG